MCKNSTHQFNWCNSHAVVMRMMSHQPHQSCSFEIKITMILQIMKLKKKRRRRMAELHWCMVSSLHATVRASVMEENKWWMWNYSWKTCTLYRQTDAGWVHVMDSIVSESWQVSGWVHVMDSTVYESCQTAWWVHVKLDSSHNLLRELLDPSDAQWCRSC